MPTTFTDLPPELLDQIISYLPSASSVANLAASSQTLRTRTEKHGWKAFAATKFPSLRPLHANNYQDVTRSLATVSKAFDRKAFVARYIEPVGHITAFPQGSRSQRWPRPRGQTIGFTPHLDVYEQIGSRWNDRREILAYSAGAELVVRETFRESHAKTDRSSWMTYKPFSAIEGKDDITSVAILRPNESGHASEQIIIGTASGDLQLLSLPNHEGTNVVKAYFTTQGLPIRYTSLLQSDCEKKMLAANLGDSRICLYHADSEHLSRPKIAPISEVDVLSALGNGNAVKSSRIWGTKFLSSRRLAVSLGPCVKPTAVYELRDDGLSERPIRTFGVQDSQENRCDALDGIVQKPTNTVYPIVPLPPYNAASGGVGDLFLSGGYDGIVRLHDLRSNKDVEQSYIDPVDDSPIYCLLPRGRETIIAGASRHSYVKFFDMRMGAKCYSYQDVGPCSQNRGQTSPDWNLFLEPTDPIARQSSRQTRRTSNSIYSIASSSQYSPYIYAGIENSVVELAFTSIADRHPDPVLGHDLSNLSFKPPIANQNWNEKSIINMAGLDNWQLRKQKGLQNTMGFRQSIFGFDERWYAPRV